MEWVGDHVTVCVCSDEVEEAPVLKHLPDKPPKVRLPHSVQPHTHAMMLLIGLYMYVSNFTRPHTLSTLEMWKWAALVY